RVRVTAATRRPRSPRPPGGGKPASRKPYWDYVLTVPPPRLVVVQELDQPPGGALWGEVNASIHLALGCVGVLTDGTVRDLEEVGRLGFQFWAEGGEGSDGDGRRERVGRPGTGVGLAGA